MDTIVYLKNTAGAYSFCSADGGNTSQPPSLARNVQTNLVLTFLDENGDALTLPTCSSFNFAADNDWADASVPKILVVSGITQSANTVIIPVRPSSNELITAITGKEFLPLNAELKGYQVIGSEPVPVFPAKFKITIENSIYNGTETPTETPADYYLKTEVDALMQAATVYQFSIDGSTNWHDTYASTDKFYRERVDITGSSWSAALPLGRSEIIIDSKNHSFSTTENQAAAIEFTKTTLEIASDSEPQVSLWSVSGGVKTKIADSSYNTAWSTTTLTITYYQAWAAGDWILKLS